MPVQVPCEEVKDEPVVAVPDTAGTEVLPGACITEAVLEDEAEVVPAELVLVTVKRKYLPTSAVVTV